MIRRLYTVRNILILKRDWKGIWWFTSKILDVDTSAVRWHNGRYHRFQMISFGKLRFPVASTFHKTIIYYTQFQSIASTWWKWLLYTTLSHIESYIDVVTKTTILCFQLDALVNLLVKQKKTIKFTFSLLFFSSTSDKTYGLFIAIIIYAWLIFINSSL